MRVHANLARPYGSRRRRTTANGDAGEAARARGGTTRGRLSARSSQSPTWTRPPLLNLRRWMEIERLTSTRGPPLVGGRDTVRPWPCRRGEGRPAPPAGQLRGGEGKPWRGIESLPTRTSSCGSRGRRHMPLPARRHRRRGMPGAPRARQGGAALPLLLPRRRGYGHRMDWSW